MRGGPRRFSIETVQKIRELFRAGLTYQQLCEKLDIPFSHRNMNDGRMYTSILHNIIINVSYHDASYTPPTRAERKSINASRYVQRLPADECPHRCQVCGMGYPVIGHEPFASEAEALACCERVALIEDAGCDRDYRSDGSILRRPHRKPSEAAAPMKRSLTVPCPVKVSGY